MVPTCCVLRLRTHAVALISAAVLTSACRYGTDQQPPSDVPREFRSSAGGGLIEHVLILPSYSLATGVSSGGGHGPKDMTSRHVIAGPFQYRPGDRFVIVIPDARGLSLPPLFFAGRSASLRGVIAVARNHRPRWIGDLWSDRIERVIVLDQSTADDWTRFAGRMRANIARSQLKSSTEPDEPWMNVPPDEAVALTFTTPERERVLRFFAATDANR